MRKIFLIAFTTGFLLGVCFYAQASDVKYPKVNAQVSFKAVTELASKQPDETISYGDDSLQFGALWAPETNNKKSLIVLVHGGCWLNAFGVDHAYPMATALVQAGHPVWALEYRRAGDSGGGWPGSFEDIKRALKNIDRLKEYGVNTHDPILMGHSAGGHLALLAATELPDIDFKRIIGLAAITDISRYALGKNSCQQATSKFMGGLPNERSLAYQTANQIYRTLPANTLLLQGDADRIVPVLQSQLYDTEQHIVSGAGHFDWVHPGTPAFTKLLDLLIL